MFQKLLFKDREEVARPFYEDEQRLTRYSPDEERPQGSAHLTRFSRRHIREGAGQRAREEALPTPQPQQPVLAEPQTTPQAGPDLDLYSDQPISINVLVRALPERFSQVQTEISDAFDQKSVLRKLA